MVLLCYPCVHNRAVFLNVYDKPNNNNPKSTQAQRTTSILYNIFLPKFINGVAENFKHQIQLKEAKAVGKNPPIDIIAIRMDNITKNQPQKGIFKGL